MFDDKFFGQWLDNQAQKAMEQVANEQSLSPEQVMVLLLNAQAGYFAHLNIKLRKDIQAQSKRLSDQMQSMNDRLGKEMQELRKDMDKRFEMLISRIDHFMIWSFATTFTMGGLVVAAIKLLP